MTETPPHPGIIAPPPLMLLVALAAGFALDCFVPLGWLAGIPAIARWATGAVLLLIAIAVNLQGFSGFQRAKTPVHPWKTTTALVTSGVFSHVRNPMYLGMILLPTALGFLLAIDWLIVCDVLFFLVLHFGVVRREEQFLELKFGEQYRGYKARVPPYGWRF